MKDLDPRAIMFLIAVGIGLIAVYNFSRSIGADFQTTLVAVLWSTLTLCVAGVLCFTEFRPSLPVLTSGTSCLLWPIWWKVIDSIANGGSDPDTLEFRFPVEVFWNTSTFKYGIEIGLVSLFLFFLSRRNRYRY